MVPWGKLWAVSCVEEWALTPFLCYFVVSTVTWHRDEANFVFGEESSYLRLFFFDPPEQRAVDRIRKECDRSVIGWLNSDERRRMRGEWRPKWPNFIIQIYVTTQQRKQCHWERLLSALWAQGPGIPFAVVTAALRTQGKAAAVSVLENEWGPWMQPEAARIPLCYARTDTGVLPLSPLTLWGLRVATVKQRQCTQLRWSAW